MQTDESPEAAREIAGADAHLAFRERMLLPLLHCVRDTGSDLIDRVAAGAHLRIEFALHGGGVMREREFGTWLDKQLIAHDVLPLDDGVAEMLDALGLAFTATMNAAEGDLARLAERAKGQPFTVSLRLFRTVESFALRIGGTPPVFDWQRVVPFERDQWLRPQATH